MNRSEWLKMIRAQAEALYDNLAPAYWTKFGLYANAAHRQFIEKFLGRFQPPQGGEVSPRSLLDAACGAGRYDGMLLEAGHSVLGTDQSASMLARARQYFPPERFPRLNYARIGLQEIDFQAEFDGIICIDALEHLSPEDWPGVVARFHKALKPGGVLYVTVEVAELDGVREAYEQAVAQGMPVVFGEVVEKVAAADYVQAAAGDQQALVDQGAGLLLYHYYPPMEQVRAWFDQAGLVIEEEGLGDGYAHLILRKR